MHTDTQVAPTDAQAASSMQADGGAGGSFHVIPGEETRGVCAICGNGVSGRQARTRNDLQQYVHEDCLVNLGPCCQCNKMITNACTKHIKTNMGKLVHVACDYVYSNCAKCKGPIMRFAEGRLGDKAGNYFHATCATAAPTLGVCTACKKWVTKKEGGVKCDDKLYHNGCAPPR